MRNLYLRSVRWRDYYKITIFQVIVTIIIIITRKARRKELLDCLPTILLSNARMGARYMTLTHSCNTPWAEAAQMEEGGQGLSEFGEKVVNINIIF